MRPLSLFLDGGPAPFPAWLADSFADRLRGWLGRRDSDHCLAILLTPCNAVHFFGTRVPLDLYFLDGSGRVLRRHLACAPGSTPRFHLGAARVLEVVSGTLPSASNPQVIRWKT